MLSATLSVGCAGISSVTNLSLALAQTPGEYFQQFLVKAHAECKERQLGPYMPSDEPQLSSRRANHSCHFLFLKPWWETLDEAGRFAHSVKLPAPHDKPADVYRPGMSPRQYFEALCAAQAGEFIFKTVEGVDGIVELRPRQSESSEMNRHLTAFEDPATFAFWQASAATDLTTSKLYHFVETYKLGKKIRIARDPSARPSDRRLDPISEFSPRYGFVWRGINDARQIENGISGGEFLIIDLQSKEVLGIKRGFKFRWLGRFPIEQTISATGFEGGASCPEEIERAKKQRYKDFTDFLITVLKPASITTLFDKGQK